MDNAPVQKAVVTKKYDKDETMRKFTNTKDIITKAAEENAKIKPPTKDYLDGEVKTTYKEESTLEKPKFMTNTENISEQPKFVEIDNREDVIIIFLLNYFLKFSCSLRKLQRKTLI